MRRSSADPRRLLGFTLLSLLLLATSLSVWETMTIRSSVPSRATWSAAAQHVMSQLQTGDLVTWYPEWAGEGRLSLHGLPIKLLPHQGSVDFGEANRLWVLGAFGYDGRSIAKGKHLSSRQPLNVLTEEWIQSDESGAVSITLLQVGGEKVTEDLYKDLSDPSKVEIYRTSRNTFRSSTTKARHEHCNLWALNGWHCPSASPRVREKIKQCLERPQSKQLRGRSKQRALYQLDKRRWLPYIDCHLNPTEHISRDWRFIDDTPRRCLSIIPHHGRQVEIRWFISQRDQKRLLSFSFGWEDLSVRHPFRDSQAQAIELEIRHGQQSLFDRSLHPQVEWRREEFELPADDETGPPMPLSIVYRAPNGVRDANMCISLNVRAKRVP